MSSRDIAKRIIAGETTAREDTLHPLNVLFQIQDLIKQRKFDVSINKMIASNETTFIICIDHPDRPKDAKPWDMGRMEVFNTRIEKNAEIEAARWEYFLVI